MKKKLLLTAAGVMMAFMLTACGKTKIDLNEYVKINFEGYDTIGTASIEFDYKHFVKDNDDSLRLTKEGEEERRDMKDAAKELGLDNSAADMLATYLKGELDRSEGLSNGDEVTFTWDLDIDEIEERFKVELTYDDITEKVKGLTEAEAFDPFDGFTLEFSGTAPNGVAEVRDNTSNDLSLRYELDKSNGLSNGDVITVTVSSYYGDDVTTYCVENFGMLPTVLEQEYTVSGLPEYIASAADISEDTIDKMVAQASDALTADAAGWSDSELDNVTYVGNYFLTPKDPDNWGSKNILTLVFKVSVRPGYTYDDVTYYNEDGCYYYYGFTWTDLMKLDDGTESINLSGYNRNYGWSNVKFIVDYKGWRGKDETATRYFDGYTDLDTMFNELVTSKIETYNYENNVSTK